MFCCLGPWLASYRGHHHQVEEIINEKERSKNDGGSSLDLVSAILDRGQKIVFIQNGRSTATKSIRNFKPKELLVLYCKVSFKIYSKSDTIISHFYQW
jgi:hypothetical protein